MLIVEFFFDLDWNENNGENHTAPMPEQPIEPKSDHSTTKIIIVLLLVLVLAAVACGAVYYFGGFREKEKHVLEYEEKEEIKETRTNETATEHRNLLEPCIHMPLFLHVNISQKDNYCDDFG